METSNKYSSLAEYNAKNVNKRHVFILNHVNPTPSVSQFANNKPTGLANYFPVSVSLPMEDEVFDANIGRMRVIRYVPGEMSIFKDEQAKDDPANSRRPERLMFMKGELVVDSRETQKLEYLMASDANGANPNRNTNKPVKYFALDLAKSLKTEIDKDKIKQKAIMWALEAPFDDILSFANSLNIPTDREPEETRWALKLKAEESPEQFLRALENPAMKRKHFIQKAIEFNVININQNRAICWTGGGIIQTTPMGKDPIDFLVDATFGSDEGEKVYAVIQSQLAEAERSRIRRPMAPIIKEEDMNFVPPAIKKPTETVKDKYELLMDEAIAKNVMEKNGPAWILYAGDKFQKKALIQRFKQDAEFFNKITAEILATENPTA